MQLKEILARPEGPERTAKLVAWVQALYGEDAEVPVLVGGAAVELLTGGAYTTGDLAFAGLVPTSVALRLSEAGFEKEGRHWIHAVGRVFLEFPTETLEPEEESVDLDVAGCRLRVLAPEAVLVDRLTAWEFWGSSTDAVNAFLVLRAVGDGLEWGTVDKLAQKRDVGGALERLRVFNESLCGSQPSERQLVRWAEEDVSS